jgi:hypothetical protein
LHPLIGDRDRDRNPFEVRILLGPRKWITGGT